MLADSRSHAARTWLTAEHSLTHKADSQTRAHLADSRSRAHLADSRTRTQRFCKVEARPYNLVTYSNLIIINTIVYNILMTQELI